MIVHHHILLKVKCKVKNEVAQIEMDDLLPAIQYIVRKSFRKFQKSEPADRS